MTSMAVLIPNELTERNQWVVWKREERDGKTTKVPYRATNPSARASSTDPTTWSGYRDACETAQGLGYADGIGYVFAADDPYVGIDLDADLSDEDRSVIILALDSYSETSVSGNGVHVIVRASLKGHPRNRRGPIEIYEHGRYFVMTGNHVQGTPSTIENRQQQLEDVLARFLPPDPEPAAGTREPVPISLDDRELLERAFRFKNGSEIQSLYNGHTTRHGDDRSAADLALCVHLAFLTGRDPARIDRLFRSSGLIRDKWDDRRGTTTYGAMTIEKAIAGCAEVYEPAPLRQQPPSSSVATLPPLAFTERTDDIWTATRFADQNHRALRYVPAWNSWLRWDGQRWAEDDTLEYLARAKTTARELESELLRAAADEPDDHRRKELISTSKRLGVETRIRAMLTLARADTRIVVPPATLDADPWLLNTTNGTIDLRNGELRPPDPGQLLTKLAGAAYDPQATAPNWNAHLSRVLPDPEIRAFLQRLAGLSALGVVREHILPLLVGQGANGKTSTINAIAAALGDYAGQSSTDLLLRGRRSAGQATPELADLRGLRLVSVSETPEDGQLAGERAKSITGGDEITARRLHGNPFTFKPSHTVWVATNHRPRVPDDGHAMWRRLILIPFDVIIPEPEQDRDLDQKLAAERDGILRWITDGTRTYLEHGLNPPEAVVAATATYRTDEDHFGTFLTERTTEEPDASTKASEILAAQHTWAATAGEHSLTPNALAQKLQARGYERRRVKTGTRWFGLRVTHDDTLDT